MRKLLVALLIVAGCGGGASEVVSLSLAALRLLHPGTDQEADAHIVVSGIAAPTRVPVQHWDPSVPDKVPSFADAEILTAVQGLRPIADRLALTLPQLALAWVLRDPRVSSAIIGASRPAQIEENVGASGVELDRATLDEIDQVLEPVVS